MVAVYLVYGAAFVVMGVALAVYPKGDSDLRLTPHLWALAAFGLLHGANEWIDLLVLAGVADGALPSAGLLLMVASDVPLAWFGAATLLGPTRRARLVPLVLAAAWGASAGLTGLRSDAAVVFARLVLGLPSALLAGAALWVSVRRLAGPAHPARLRRVVAAGALAFVVYALAAGLVVPRTGLLPVVPLDERWFLDHVHVPVQLLRAACAIVVTGSLLGVLRLLRWEARSARDRLLAELSENRDRLQEIAAEREVQLAETRRTLDDIRSLLPVCAWCKRIRDEGGSWRKLEAYMKEVAQLDVTHSICPDCAEEHFGEEGSVSSAGP